MGKEQDLLQAVKSGDLTSTQKLLSRLKSSRNKRHVLRKSLSARSPKSSLLPADDRGTSESLDRPHVKLDSNPESGSLFSPAWKGRANNRRLFVQFPPSRHQNRRDEEEEG